MVNAAAPAAETGIRFFVAGLAKTKGSLRAMHNRGADACRVWLIEDGGFELQQWRTFVAQGAKKAIGQEMPLAGPLRVSLDFYLPRPAKQEPAHKASSYVFTRGRNDLDKLIRLCCDAMTDAALWGDDAQVAELHASKRYMGILPAGVQITVAAL